MAHSAVLTGHLPRAPPRRLVERHQRDWCHAHHDRPGINQAREPERAFTAVNRSADLDRRPEVAAGREIDGVERLATDREVGVARHEGLIGADADGSGWRGRIPPAFLPVVASSATRCRKYSAARLASPALTRTLRETRRCRRAPPAGSHTTPAWKRHRPFLASCRGVERMEVGVFAENERQAAIGGDGRRLRRRRSTPSFTARGDRHGHEGIAHRHDRQATRDGGRRRDKGIAAGGAGGTEGPFQFPATASTAKRPPRFDEFPPRIVVPASTAASSHENQD